MAQKVHDMGSHLNSLIPKIPGVDLSKVIFEEQLESVSSPRKNTQKRNGQGV